MIRQVQRLTQCSKYRRRCSGGQPCELCVSKERVCEYTRDLRKRGPLSGHGFKTARPPKVAVPSIPSPPPLVEMKPRLRLVPSVNLKEWTHHTFENMGIVNVKDEEVSFIEYYFKYSLS